MPHDGQTMTQSPLLADILGLTQSALPEVEALFVTARENLRGMVTIAGKVSAPALEEHQYAAHALAWLATYVESLRQMRNFFATLLLTDPAPAPKVAELCFVAALALVPGNDAWWRRLHVEKPGQPVAWAEDRSGVAFFRDDSGVPERARSEAGRSG